MDFFEWVKLELSKLWMSFQDRIQREYESDPVGTITKYVNMIDSFINLASSVYSFVILVQDSWEDWGAWSSSSILLI